MEVRYIIRFCFIAYIVLLELERTLRKTADKKNKKPGITIYRAKFLAESLYNIEYVKPYNGKKMSVMLCTDYDEEVTKLLDAIGVKSYPLFWVTSPAGNRKFVVNRRCHCL